VCVCVCVYVCVCTHTHTHTEDTWKHEQIDFDITRQAVDSRIKSNDRSRVSEIISDNSYAIGEQCHDCLIAAIQSAGSTYMERTGWTRGFSLEWDFAWTISIGGRAILECTLYALSWESRLLYRVTRSIYCLFTMCDILRSRYCLPLYQVAL